MAWDVAVTLSGLLWTRGVIALPISRRARLTAADLQAAREWASLLPAPRWAHLLHPGGAYWPMGLAQPLAKAPPFCGGQIAAGGCPHATRLGCDAQRRPALTKRPRNGAPRWRWLWCQGPPSARCWRAAPSNPWVRAYT